MFRAPVKFHEFTNVYDADVMLNDLDHGPHAFVIGCIMDRQVRAERAWIIPYRLAQKLGSFRFKKLARLSLREITRLMSQPEPLHRFPVEMSKNLHAAIQTIVNDYDGKADRIWAGQPSSADVVYRFLQFRGVGLKIATMAANILARDFKVPFADYYSIDVSVDIQVRRVFRRLGSIGQNDDIATVVYSARSLHPEFPGLLDSPAWEIGRNWCRPRIPLCDECFMQRLCPTANGRSKRERKRERKR